MKSAFLPCVRTALLGLALMFSAASAHAQTFPERAVTWINPYPAGSASDVTARLFADEFSKAIKQPVVVINKPGAGGLIGTNAGATAAPDGYTLLVGAIGTHVFNPVINSSTNYDPVKDFEPVSRIVSFPNVLVVSSKLGVNTVEELIALAKSKSASEPLLYSTAGNGTTSHIAAGQFERLAGVKLTGVNYKGTPAAVNEVLAGRIDFVFGNINVILPQVKAGTLKALAIASSERYSLLPDTPTFNEVGMPEMEMVVWSGLFAPAGTPPEIVKVLNEAANTVARSGVLQPVYESAGATLEVDATPEDFAKLLQADTAKWVPVLKEMGIKAQ
ncbi:Bug family tripartite tricarboxylate transporter substrate binding protein [Pollutimonas thiosulfatoxidans]|uniref:MFS transporter n=1 Tax=Pollutimonas thiosulfatoxidans TaxID=2028345 RepID=A0A410GE89_9BURK|nr:tripartite tricarboxylate transporter substrate binding protein [Pollutimonas thiosulfatoxidans]NYT44280.1 tripartite tricarboxylate transporter substrate binding protein [Alcaligenaceae bacterium]QAA94617.1 hypothetical protein CKA81_12820 [Pollutimonas thiosulfatoxidans]